MEKKLSEEEIIKILTDDVIAYGVGHEKYEEAIQGLLDLYNKEKEKREISEENHKVLSLDLVLEINKKYISKDKIKELIENELIDISGFRCIAVEDIENLLED